MTKSTRSNNELLRESEVADLLSVSVWTLRYWRRHDRGPRWARLGGRIVYPARLLAEHILNLPGGGGKPLPASGTH
jgi:predicted DNA-binding transcriptional regulator AlpA